MSQENIPGEKERLKSSAMDDPIKYFIKGFQLKMIQILKAKFKKSSFPLARSHSAI